ncbi:MAG: type II toxin-antitoxin system VapC family toxin [Ruminococcus sp.]|nr:type II toxin-antitoxin system VapC family toxin [Ruminococcus sp.]MCM1381126.1 type II toxin-antitoxin system VapC family toxin [Muribaculaceae bacterium]MCM1478089.1 type II toxin-antitoxin system VapC family toxin [Muribaculaceae bacterium]
MKYMLDTNMCIYAQKRVPSVIGKIRENYRDGIAVSSVTLAELEYGVQASANPERNTVALLKFLAVAEVLPFDGKAAAEYGKIRADLRKKGTPIGELDMLIAAHARAEKLIIVTHNTREFKRVEGLSLEDWY